MDSFTSLNLGDTIVLNSPRLITAQYYIDELGITELPPGTQFIVVLNEDFTKLGVQLLKDGIPFPNLRGLHYCIWFQYHEAPIFDLLRIFGTSRTLPFKKENT